MAFAATQKQKQQQRRRRRRKLSPPEGGARVGAGAGTGAGPDPLLDANHVVVDDKIVGGIRAREKTAVAVRTWSRRTELESTISVMLPVATLKGTCSVRLCGLIGMRMC